MHSNDPNSLVVAASDMSGNAASLKGFAVDGVTIVKEITRCCIAGEGL